MDNQPLRSEARLQDVSKSNNIYETDDYKV